MKKRILFIFTITALLILTLSVSVFAEDGDKKVADCEFDLITHDSSGNRLVGVTETNLGNLIADAFRIVLDADIAYFNGGGIKSHVDAGEITHNELLKVLPDGNTGVVVEVDGATVLKMLNAAVSKWPGESESFPHASGILFFVNVLEESDEKVYGAKILNPKTGDYEPLELDKMYTVASNDFILLEGGDGMDMFEDAEVISDTGILDVEILEKYIDDQLEGVIDARYARATRHVTFTEGDSGNYSYVTDGDHAVVIAAVGIILALITIITVLIIRKKRGM